MKRITILIFLCLLLSSSLTITAIAYSIDGVPGAHHFSLIDSAPALGTAEHSSYSKAGHPEVMSDQLLLARASGCSSCEDEGDPEG